jgi:DNA polymerase III psi subunit
LLDQSLTCCGKAKVATTLARRSGLCKINHLHTGKRQKWQQHQQGGLDFVRPITYILCKGKSGNNISKEVWTLQDQSLTGCEKAKVMTTSARRLGLCKTNHLHTVKRQEWRQHQQGGLDFTRSITYTL